MAIVSVFSRDGVFEVLVFPSIVVVFLLFSSIPAAATAEIDSTDTSPQKYWIELTERPSSSAASPPWTAPVASTYVKQLREAGIRPLVRSRWLHAVSALLTPAQRDTVRSLPFVRHIGPVATGRRSTVSPPSLTKTGLVASAADSLRLGRSRERLARMNAVLPMERGLDGRGVRIGFLDAHFRGLRHPTFASLRRHDRMRALRDFTEGTQSGNHGSAVASVTVGESPGTLVGPAHGAEVLGATTEYTPSERNVEEDFFVAGLEWLHRRGADVVNASIGYTTFDEGEDDYATDDLDGDTGMTTRAVDRAAQLGMTVVVSAGNSGCDSPDSCWYHVNTPADADSAIAVGAVAPDSTLASFSARGPTADGRIKPDVVVQGESVLAAWNDRGFAEVGGTSFASPQVTAVVAQMLQVNPDLSPMEVRRLLRHTASQANNPDNRRGWGIVNADAAVRAAERRARATPPSALTVEEPYIDAAETKLTIPVHVPARTSTVRVSLHSTMGREVMGREMPVHPGPNWLPVDLHSFPSGLFYYRVRGEREVHTGTVALP